jgi:hypothetical protein
MSRRSRIECHSNQHSYASCICELAYVILACKVVVVVVVAAAAVATAAVVMFYGSSCKQL